MNRIYILLISLVFIACGKEKQEQAATEQMVDDNTISVSKTQFESEKMQLGTIIEQEFNETVKTTGFIASPYLRYYYHHDKILEDQLKEEKTRAQKVMEIEEKLLKKLFGG